jgi:hypothetical protein
MASDGRDRRRRFVDGVRHVGLAAGRIPRSPHSPHHASSSRASGVSSRRRRRARRQASGRLAIGGGCGRVLSSSGHGVAKICYPTKRGEESLPGSGSDDAARVRLGANDGARLIRPRSLPSHPRELSVLQRCSARRCGVTRLREDTSRVATAFGSRSPSPKPGMKPKAIAGVVARRRV